MALWIGFLFVGLAKAQTTTAPVRCPSKALTETQVLDLVKSGLPEARIGEMGRERLGASASVVEPKALNVSADPAALVRFVCDGRGNEYGELRHQ